MFSRSQRIVFFSSDITQLQIHLLNLQNSLVTVKNTAPAAKNRFIYISDRRRGLELVPSGPLDWFSSPYLASTLLLAFLRDIFKDGNRREVLPISMTFYVVTSATAKHRTKMGTV